MVGDFWPDAPMYFPAPKTWCFSKSGVYQLKGLVWSDLNDLKRNCKINSHCDWSYKNCLSHLYLRTHARTHTHAHPYTNICTYLNILLFGGQTNQIVTNTAQVSGKLVKILIASYRWKTDSPILLPSAVGLNAKRPGSLPM